MDYQEIVTIYKNHGLSTPSLRKRLEEAKPLKGRPNYRIFDMSMKTMTFGNRVVDLIRVPERDDKIDFFEKESAQLLEEHYDYIIGYIKEYKAWKMMGLKASDYSKEKFLSSKNSEKFKMLYELNQKYTKFLEFQKIADIRDYLGANKDNGLDDETLKKLCFLKLMFANIKSEILKLEVFCLDKEFLMALVNFKRSSYLRIEDYIENRKKKLQNDFNQYSKFFSTEEFRDIAENILLASQTTKYTLTKTIGAYYQMSESEAEQGYLSEQYKSLKDLEEKVTKMTKVRFEFEKVKRIQEIKEVNRIREEKGRQKAEEYERRQQTASEKIQKAKERAKQQVSGGRSIKELEDRIAVLKGTPTAKEKVHPIIFSWFEREDISFARKIGNKKLDEFFETIKQIEKETGIRASLFFVTNSNKEITLKRFNDLRKRAKDHGMPRLIEGAFGGYSAFRIDESGTVKDISVMSEENKKKIIYLLQNTNRFNLTPDMLDSEGTDFLRYKFSDSTDTSITKQYLAMMIGRLLSNESVKKQPLKFYRYMEKHSTGIDVVLESQVKGISKLQEYYESKYDIQNSRCFKINVEDIDEFIGNKAKVVKENVNIVEEK